VPFVKFLLVSLISAENLCRSLCSRRLNFQRVGQVHCNSVAVLVSCKLFGKTCLNSIITSEVQMECNRLGLCRCSAIADARLWGLRGVRGGGGGHAEGFRRGTSGLHAAGIRAQGARHLRHDIELLPLLPREWPRMTPHGGQLCFDISLVFIFLLPPLLFILLRSIYGSPC